MAEAWQNTTDGQQISRGYNNGGAPTFGSRNFNNSNYRAPRRDNNGMSGGYGQGGPRYSNGGVGGYNQQQQQQQRGFTQQNGGRQYYDRQPRMNVNGGAPRTYTFDPNQAYSTVGFDIASDKVGMVIGRGGGKIRQIQDDFNVHVKIDRDQGMNGLTGVTIRGEENSIEQAKHFIQELIAVK